MEAMAPKVSERDPRPPYVQIADDLRSQMGSGPLKVGDRLPSTRELAATYEVAQMTIHHALRILRGEGRVETWQGRGSFVAEPAPPSTDDVGAQIQALADAVRSLDERLKRVESQSD